MIWIALVSLGLPGSILWNWISRQSAQDRDFDKDGFGFFGTLFFVLPSGALIFGLLSFIFYVPVDSCQKIIEIGGCTRYSCGVKLEDGSYIDYTNPVVGMYSCTRSFKYRF